MLSSTLLNQFQKLEEAYRVRHGLPVNRTHTDDELASCQASLAEAEADLFGHVPPTKKRVFVATYTIDHRTEQINVLASDACAATARVMELVMSDGGENVRPMNIRIKVEPQRLRILPCAA